MGHVVVSPDVAAPRVECIGADDQDEVWPVTLGICQQKVNIGPAGLDSADTTATQPQR
jgi:hypothetical protein